MGGETAEVETRANDKRHAGRAAHGAGTNSVDLLKKAVGLCQGRAMAGRKPPAHMRLYVNHTVRVDVPAKDPARPVALLDHEPVARLQAHLLAALLGKVVRGDEQALRLHATPREPAAPHIVGRVEDEGVRPPAAFEVLHREQHLATGPDGKYCLSSRYMLGSKSWTTSVHTPGGIRYPFSWTGACGSGGK